MSAHSHPNQFALLSQRRFAPFFWTQLFSRVALVAGMALPAPVANPDALRAQVNALLQG